MIGLSRNGSLRILEHCIAIESMCISHRAAGRVAETFSDAVASRKAGREIASETSQGSLSRKLLEVKTAARFGYPSSINRSLTGSDYDAVHFVLSPTSRFT